MWALIQAVGSYVSCDCLERTLSPQRVNRCVYSEKTWQWKELLDASHRTGQAAEVCRPQKLADYYWSDLTKPCKTDRRTGVGCTSFVTSDVKMKKITANKTPECVICGLGLKVRKLIFQCIDEARAALMRCRCLFHHKSLMDARRWSEFLWQPFSCNVSWCARLKQYSATCHIFWTGMLASNRLNAMMLLWCLAK